MKNELQAVIFDLDGVIVDTFELYYLANKTAANNLSIPFTLEDNEKFRGIGRMKIIESMVKKAKVMLSEREKRELAETKNKHYQKLINDIDEAFILPGMKQLIIDLKKDAVKIGIASSSTNGETVLHKIGLLKHIDTIVDPNSLSSGKPDPEIFLKAAANLRVPQENCVAIEDGNAGMEAIKSTNMFSIGIGKEKRMETADWHVLKTDEITYHELLERFERWLLHE